MHRKQNLSVKQGFHTSRTAAGRTIKPCQKMKDTNQIRKFHEIATRSIKNFCFIIAYYRAFVKSFSKNHKNLLTFSKKYATITMVLIS